MFKTAASSFSSTTKLQSLSEFLMRICVANIGVDGKD